MLQSKSCLEHVRNRPTLKNENEIYDLDNMLGPDEEVIKYSTFFEFL